MGGLDDRAEISSSGRYQLVASLGHGGMADVYLAVSHGPAGFNKLVVVKRLRNNLAQEPSFLAMFLDEARLAARLNHPNVVQTYEVGEEDGTFFIAMEYLEGQPLNKIQRNAARHGGLNPGMSIYVMSGALAGLHHAHELKDFDGTPLGIVHRDVSPHNVFVTYEGQVKLVDFGIAKAALSPTQTEVGVIKGKIAYMAPEQATGSPIDRRADLFGAGVVLWELLAQRRLMGNDNSAAMLHRLITEPIPRVSTVVPEIDPELDDIVAKALEKAPEDRYQTAQEMRAALTDWARRSGNLLTQEEVAQDVAEMFRTVRENIEQRIQQALGSGSLKPLRYTTTSTNPKPLMSSLTPASGVMHLGSSDRPPVSEKGRTIADSPSAFTAQRSRRTAVIIAFFACMFIGGIGAWAWVSRAPAEPVVSRVEGVPPVEPTPPPSAAPTATATEAPVATAMPSATAHVEPTSEPTTTRVVTNNRQPRPGPAPRPSSAPTAAPTADAPASGNGYLSLVTYPWTKVYAGGRLLGTTPLYNVALPPGTHSLTLENSEEGIRKGYSVTIKSGESTSRSLDLNK